MGGEKWSFEQDTYLCDKASEYPISSLVSKFNSQFKTRRTSTSLKLRLSRMGFKFKTNLQGHDGYTQSYVIKYMGITQDILENLRSHKYVKPVKFESILHYSESDIELINKFKSYKSIRQVADKLNIKYATVHKWVMKGELPTLKIGTSLYIEPQVYHDIFTFFDNHLTVSDYAKRGYWSTRTIYKRIKLKQLSSVTRFGITFINKSD